MVPVQVVLDAEEGAVRASKNALRILVGGEWYFWPQWGLLADVSSCGDYFPGEEVCNCENALSGGGTGSIGPVGPHFPVRTLVRGLHQGELSRSNRMNRYETSSVIPFWHKCRVTGQC